MRARLVPLVLFALALPGAAQGQNGQFTGSYHHTTGEGEGDAMRLRYDVGAREAVPGGIDMNLRMSLQYQRRPGEADTDLLRGRFFGDLRRDVFRLHGQFTPWQATAPGPRPARERNVQVGLDIAPRSAPRLALNVTRLDRDLANGRSASEDRRADLSWGGEAVGGQMGFRSLDTEPAPGLAASSRTREWRGGLSGSKGRGAFTTRASLDLLYSEFDSRERARILRSQGVQWSGAWAPGRRFSLNTSATGRWGLTTDNAFAKPNEVNERYFSTAATARPFEGLETDVLHEHRSRAGANGGVADYLQLDASFRRAVLEAMRFHTGYRRTVTIRSESGDVPNSSAWALVDGRLRPAIDARAEIRASIPVANRAAGTQLRRLAQLRTRPSRRTRLDVTWSRDTLPIAILPRSAAVPGDTTAPPADTLAAVGVAQRDRQWDFSGGYEPFSGASVVGSLRLLEGEGRVGREERLATVTSSMRVSRRSTLSLQYSRRRASARYLATVLSEEGTGQETVEAFVTSKTSETVRGADLAFWLPGEFRMRTSWLHASRSGREATTTWGVTVDRSF
jgi:hypothetical protein